MTDSKKTAAADTMSELTQDSDFKALLKSMVSEQAAVVAAAETAELKAKLAKLEKVAAVRSIKPVLAIKDREVIRDKVSGDVITGKRGGHYPAQFAITPDGGRTKWVSASVVRVIVENLKEAKAILKACDKQNGVES